MTAPFLAWSHSRLKQFRDCPKALWHNVAPKGHPDRCEYVETQPMRDGKEIDEALTKRISKKVPLPPKFQHWEPMVQSVLTAPGTKLTQVALALNESFAPCGYKDWDNAWARAIFDVAVINGDYAWIGDWKNGAVWLDEEQLRLFAIFGFHHYPEVDKIDTSYIWLKHGTTSDKSYTRRELPDLWQTFIPDVERMQAAHKTNHFPPTPSKRACRFCAANREHKCAVAAVPFGG